MSDSKPKPRFVPDRFVVDLHQAGDTYFGKAIAVFDLAVLAESAHWAPSALEKMNKDAKIFLSPDELKIYRDVLNETIAALRASDDYLKARERDSETPTAAPVNVKIPMKNRAVATLVSRHLLRVALHSKAPQRDYLLRGSLLNVAISDFEHLLASVARAVMHELPNLI